MGSYSNSSTGSLTIGSVVSNTYSKLALRGPNFSHGIEGKRAIIFDFAVASEAYNKSILGYFLGYIPPVHDQDEQLHTMEDLIKNQQEEISRLKITKNEKIYAFTPTGFYGYDDPGAMDRYPSCRW